jgi:adenine-specific DNA-methyltransferase
MTEPQKVDLKSLDIAEERRQKLKELFPEVFREEKIDFDQLKRALGEWVESGKERFGLSWPGKADCMKIIQAPSLATLKPVRDESMNFDDTQNLFIEGDNLEVLKLLQKSYCGKVKMIYIDPPYNTGNEFIYPDDFAETLDTYLEYTGQKDSDGRKFFTNTDTNGRYHSRWLSMMYPRLYLARSLLKNDGIVFISIDDNEQSNLKQLCDQVFGEENFIENIIWRKKSGGGQQDDYFVTEHDYIVCYAKNKDEFKLRSKTAAAKTNGYNQIDLERGQKYKRVKLAKWVPLCTTTQN